MNKKGRKWCGNCGIWTYPNDKNRCIECNNLIRLYSRQGSNKDRQIRMALVKRY